MRAIRIAFAALLLAVTTSFTVGTSPAGAVVVTECANTTELLGLRFNPPLTLTAQQSQFLQFGADVDPTATCLGGFVGTVDINNTQGSGLLSCTASTDIDGGFNAKWSDNTNSHVELTTFAIEDGPGSVSKVITLEGEVKSGKFAGSTVVVVVVATLSDTTACTTGLEQLSGNFSLTFTP